MKVARTIALSVLVSVGCGLGEEEVAPPPVDPETINIDGKADGDDLFDFVRLLTWAREQPRKLLYDGKWTNWSKNNRVLALVKLATMRWILDNENLFHSYPDGARTGYLSTSFQCPASTQLARTIDGSCNDLEDPGMGAANTRFGHNVPLDSIRGETGAQLLDPNPREISRELLTRTTFKPVPFLNLLAASWIQFMIHDWFSHGDNRSSEAITVPLAADDPLRAKYNVTSLRVPLTAADPSRRSADGNLPDTYVNEVTHWWDGSQIYGSDVQTASRLRSGQGGKLRVEANGLMPLASDGLEDTGFKRNWWLGLAMMHNLFVREHNAIATHLAASHPDWSDQRLYDVARLVNSAVMAKIHTVEWTPAILPNSTLGAGMRANWFGLFSFLERLGISFDDPVLFGIVGNSRNLNNVPFSITEEFVSVYRMHNLLPESLSLRAVGGGGGEEVPMPTTRNIGARTLMRNHTLGDLFYSFGTQHPGQLVLNNFPQFLQDLSIPMSGPVDMGTIDVIRDRERGVPRYNEFRRLMNLKPLASFSEISPDASVVASLKRVYGNDIEKLDLLVGCLAEGYRPKNFGFGETAFQVFILMASRRLQADRFFTDSYNEETYSKEGLKWVEDATMKKVLLRHMPELASTGLGEVDNAFKPWD